MSYFPFVAGGVALLLAGLLIWSLRRAGKRKPISNELVLGDFVCEHIAYLPQIRQSLLDQDIHFLSGKGHRRLAQKIRRERRKITLAYLDALRNDFDQLLNLARVVAVLSPELVPGQEWKRLQLTMIFAVKYRVLRTRLLLGGSVSEPLCGLSMVVSKLAIDMERAITELGERAALGSETGSTLD